MSETSNRLPIRLPGTLVTPVLLAWAFILPACLRVVADPDTGWHLAQGRILAAGQFIHTNRLTWPVFNQPWSPTSWLYDWLAFEVTSHTGLFGLQLLTFVFTAAALLLLALACRELHELGPWVIPSTALLIMVRVTERPHVVSWLVFAAVLWLGFVGERRDWRFRLCATPIIAIGCDFHPGGILGAIALVLFCLDAMRRERAYLRELGIIGATVLALLANPGGITDTLEHLRIQETIRIQEFEPPDWHNAAPYFILLPLALVIGLLHRKRPILLALAIVYGALGCLAVRLTVDFYVACAPILAGGLALIGEPRAVIARMATALVLLAAALVTNRHQLELGPWRPEFDERRLPVRAAEFIRSEHITGIGFNSFADGGYLEYVLPEIRAYQDGRIHAFPPDFFHREEAAEKSGDAFERYLTGNGAEFALTGRHEGGLSGQGLIHTSEWALVYWDDVSELYLRRSIPRFASVIKSHEYYFFKPRADDISALASAGKRGLEEMRAEADRFDMAVGKPDVAAALLRCGAESRLRAETADTSCAAALALRVEKGYHELILKVRAMPPVQ